jgi:hypothetical protein
MKTIYSILAILFLIPITGTLANSDSGSDPKPSKIIVYYFHYERRCANCVAIEEVTRKTLQEYYPTLVKKGTITFKSINMDEKSGENLADKLKVSGQSLLIIKDDEVKDLTEKGFLYARSSPEKLKADIKKEVDLLLK